MARNYVFPDPDDRSANDPSVLLNKKKVLGLYNQAHPNDDNMRNVTQKVRDWVDDTAKSYGWSGTEHVGGGQILLQRNDLQPLHKSDD